MRRSNDSAFPLYRLSALAVALGAIGLFGGCSSLNSVVEGKSVDYESARNSPGLDVPPDLTQLTHDPRYAMPDGTKPGTVSARAYNSTAAANPQAAAGSAVLPEFPGMHVAQSGAQRWLVVDATPDALWDKVKAFWQANGLELVTANPATGEMQTEWAENRAKLPQDVIRRYLGKVLDSVYDTGERERYRTVLQRTPDGKGTEVFISHETMVEVYSDSQKTQTVWQPGTPDPSLDTLFLQRLMVALGMKEEQAKAALQAGAAPAAPVRATPDGQAIDVRDGFDEAWRRVGLAVNTAGFTVSDRNRSAGTYDVRYVDSKAAAKAAQESGGFFSHLFGRGDKDVKPADYRIQVQAAGSGARVTVQPVQANAPGAADATQTILKVLLQQLQ